MSQKAAYECGCGKMSPEIKTGLSGVCTSNPTPDPTSVSETEWAMPQCNSIPFVFVPLSKNRVAIIDAEDAERVFLHKWSCFTNKSGAVYAQTSPKKVHRTPGQPKMVFLHRYIMEAPHGMQVDHVNGNTLDCRRQNMRLATAAENCRNRGRRSIGSTSPYKGAYLLNGKWAARIGSAGKVIFLGYFKSAEDAALAYDRAALELHGEFARLNFPEVK